MMMRGMRMRNKVRKMMGRSISMIMATITKVIKVIKNLSLVVTAITIVMAISIKISLSLPKNRYSKIHGLLSVNLWVNLHLSLKRRKGWNN